MPSNLGRLYFSEYLDGLNGIQANRILASIGKGINQVRANFRSYQSHLNARAQVKYAIDLAYETKTGRELIESAAPRKVSMALEASLNIETAALTQLPHPIVQVSTRDSADIKANLAVHELRHDQQHANIARLYGDPNIFSRHAYAFADTAYPYLVGEGDAFATQTIQAYELNLRGIKGPWAWHSFLYSKKPLAKALIVQLDKGLELHADETKKAIFDAWMIKSPLRLSYEAEYLEDILRKPILARLREPGLSHANDDLQIYTQGLNGRSYMLGSNITAPAYLGIWDKLTSREDILDAALERQKASNFFGAYSTALEIIDVLEDNANGTHKWVDLPEAYNVKSITNNTLNLFGRAVVYLTQVSTSNDAPSLAKQKVQDLLDRAQNLARYQSQFRKSGLGPTLRAGQKDLRSHRPKSRTEAAIQYARNQPKIDP